MLTVISPAKTLDFDSPTVTRKVSQPEFLDRSAQLIQTMRRQSPRQLSKLMGISDKLAELNAHRFETWQTPFSEQNARQAILAFKGDVYIGLQAETFKPKDFDFAQKHLRILSGLYGLLKPLDLIQAYRLEMGTKIKNPGGQNLYEFWQREVSEQLVKELAKQRNKTLINLASNEYFKAIDAALMPGDVITPVFKEYKNGSYKVLSFFAKKARGAMSRYIVKNRIGKPDDIKSFAEDGYRYNPDLSRGKQWVFTRKANQAPL